MSKTDRDLPGQKGVTVYSRPDIETVIDGLEAAKEQEGVTTDAAAFVELAEAYIEGADDGDTDHTPERVRCNILGQEVVADVVDATLEADASGPRDVLLVEVDGSRYRVDAADADPVGSGA